MIEPIINSESNCQWNFPPTLFGSEQGTTSDPRTDVFRKDPYYYLIRESIQNSMDAHDKASGKNFVRVDFSYETIRQVRYPNLFELKQHVEGIFKIFNDKGTHSHYAPVVKALTRQPGSSYKMGMLRISDYNTVGMDYRRDKDNIQSGRFYSFMRCSGSHNNERANTGGTRGLGKGAIFLMSPIHTILASSKTSQGDYCFQGQANIATHIIDGISYRETGYYDNNGGYPVTNFGNIPPDFRRDKAAPAGSDIYLLGFDKEEYHSNIGDMIRQVLRNYWMAILNGRLEVRFFTDSCNNVGDQAAPIAINKETIDGFMKSFFPAIEDSKVLKSNSFNPRPYYEAWVQRDISTNPKRYTIVESTLPHLGHVCLRFYRDKALPQDRLAYMNAINLFVFRERRTTHYGFAGVFYCDNPKGQAILNKLEDVTHSEWNANNYESPERSKKENLAYAKTIIAEYSQFIENAINNAFRPETGGALEIAGASKFLFATESLIKNNDDCDTKEYNNTYGTPTGQGGDEESPDIVSSIKEIEKKAHQPRRKGHALTRVRTKARQDTPNDPEPLFGGAEHEGGGARPQETSPEGTAPYTEDDREGREGVYRKAITVHYHAFAQKVDDGFAHQVVIHAPKDIENAEIELVVVGDDKNLHINLESCANGVVENGFLSEKNAKGKPIPRFVHRIKGLNLTEGRNHVKNIVFVDHEKHTLNVKTYEYRKYFLPASSAGES